MSVSVRPAFGELVATFAKIGLLSFGGAAGQIAMMHRIVVEEKRWLDEQRYLHALNYCMLLPGPEAQQLATYIGWLTHGVKGGLVAGLLFILPGAFIMLALSFLYAIGAGMAPVEGLFLGVKAAVLAIVTQALVRIAGRGLRTPPLRLLAAFAFVAILFLDLPFPLVVLGAGVAGACIATLAPAAIGLSGEPDRRAVVPAGTTRNALIAASACLAAWWAPIALTALVLGAGHPLLEIGLFFSKLAVLTFGGAYAVLAWLADAGVAQGWVTTREMIDGLGLAETTPGPTILVNQFVAYLGAMRAPAPFGAYAAATLGALLATWATFAPSFLWIFAGAPFVETLRGNRRLAGALAGITVAVVGVIGFVAVWFGLNVLFRVVVHVEAGAFRYPRVDPGSLDWQAAALSVAAFILLFVLRRGVVTTVALLAATGAAIRLAGI